MEREAYDYVKQQGATFRITIRQKMAEELNIKDGDYVKFVVHSPENETKEE